MLLVKTELESLTQSFYPLSQLQNRPLPDGVNPTSLEDYLKPHCFQVFFFFYVFFIFQLIAIFLDLFYKF